MSNFSVKQIQSILSAHNIPDADLEACANEICARHSTDLESIKEERDNFRADALKLRETQLELKKAQEALEKSGDAAKIQEAFDKYKAEVEAEKAKTAKENALRKVAKDAGLTEAGIAKAVKYTDYSGLELDDKGELKDAKSIIKSLKEEWPEHIAKETKGGANTPTPPGNLGNNGKYSSKDEIMKIKDPVQRQKAIGENLALFTGPAPEADGSSTDSETK